MRDNADLDERRKVAEQRFATIKQFQSETTDDLIARYETEYRGFLSAGNELVRSYIFGDEGDDRLIKARAEIAVSTDGAKRQISCQSWTKVDIKPDGWHRKRKYRPTSNV